MHLSDNQNKIVAFLATVESANKKEIYNGVDCYYYYNWQHYIGLTLARLIKRKLVVRVKRGVYALSPRAFNALADVNNPKSDIHPNQLSLF